MPVTFWWVSAFVSKKWLTKYYFEVKLYRDLKPYRIAALSGHGWIERHSADFHIEWVNNMEQLIPLLLGGRVDVIPASPVVLPYYGNYFEYEPDLTSFRLEDPPVPVFFYLSKASHFLDLLPYIDKSIEGARSQGILDVVLLEYASPKF